MMAKAKKAKLKKERPGKYDEKLAIDRTLQTSLRL
jgi:hypothetical protein